MIPGTTVPVICDICHTSYLLGTRSDETPTDAVRRAGHNTHGPFMQCKVCAESSPRRDQPYYKWQEGLEKELMEARRKYQARHGLCPAYKEWWVGLERRQ